MKQTYKEQLADGRWLRKKNEILERDKYTCQRCGATSNLQVHHKEYLVNKKAWEYPNEDLITLCVNCHENEHKRENYNNMSNIKNGDWVYCYQGEFRDIGVIFHIDYVTKFVYIFGCNEGSWGSPYIYSVKYKDFNKYWSAFDIFEKDDEDITFAETDYFLGAFRYAVDCLLKGVVYFSDYPCNDMIKCIAQHYILSYINHNDFFKNNYEFSDIVNMI